MSTDLLRDVIKSLGLQGQRLGAQLDGVRRCPHCGIASPLLARLWQSSDPIRRGDGQPASRWAVYACTSCAHLVTAKGDPGDNVSNPLIAAIYPEPAEAHEDIPEVARRFLQQAFETLHAPDAAAVMAGSAVDAMLKKLGFSEGSLYSRIDQALEAAILTKGMAEWAHSVRLGSNRPRHADESNPHVSPEEAKQSVEFAEALGSFLFVLTARVERGIAAAGKAG